MPARILFVDDHQLVRDGVRVLLQGETDLAIVGTANDTAKAWAAIEEQQPDLVLMDLDLPGEGGIALTERVRTKYPQIRVLVLTGHADARHVGLALRAGARGYVVKSSGVKQLLEAIRAVLSGQAYLCQEASAVLLRNYQRDPNNAQGVAVLSEREQDVLRQIADGYSTKEIAFNLGISAKTVETHRASIMAKLDINNIAELTKYALREGMTGL